VVKPPIGRHGVGWKPMRLQFVGCGDAFGSGGRFNTCFHVVGTEANFLIDCGATSFVGMKRLGIDPGAIDTILITHFHGDHFGGIPFLMLEAQLVSGRERPLIIAGPPGLPDRYRRAMDVAFPSSPQRPARFQLTLHEIVPNEPARVGPMRVSAFPVVHLEAAGPCVGYRIEVEGKVIAYSGDTEWTDTLVDIARDADLFICEAYTYDRKVKSHTDYATLAARLPQLQAKRVVLTHMAEEMLARIGDVPLQCASDGLVIEF
jgi:ribonuclease BN (tRNA processing enzyme)